MSYTQSAPILWRHQCDPVNGKHVVTAFFKTTLVNDDDATDSTSKDCGSVTFELDAATAATIESAAVAAHETKCRAVVEAKAKAAKAAADAAAKAAAKADAAADAAADEED